MVTFTSHPTSPAVTWKFMIYIYIYNNDSVVRYILLSWHVNARVITCTCLLRLSSVWPVFFFRTADVILAYMLHLFFPPWWLGWLVYEKCVNKLAWWYNLIYIFMKTLVRVRLSLENEQHAGKGNRILHVSYLWKILCLSAIFIFRS